MKVKFILKIFKFFYSFFIWTISGFKRPTGEILKKRKQLCYGCENWSPRLYGPVGGCSLCGCSKLKIYFKTESCPVKKW